MSHFDAQQCAAAVCLQLHHELSHAALSHLLKEFTQVELILVDCGWSALFMATKHDILIS